MVRNVRQAVQELRMNQVISRAKELGLRGQPAELPVLGRRFLRPQSQIHLCKPFCGSQTHRAAVRHKEAH
jgi:hypothetical protein